LDNEPTRQLIYPNALDLTPYAHNIENCIGTVSLPVGIAGPLRINGTHAVGDFVIPMATTEATLVASFHRGARLITISGGCNAVVIYEGISRAPGYVFNSMQEALEFAQWIKEHQPAIQQTAEATTHHGKLLDLSAAFEGNYLFLIFDYETGDAAGQNIATIATQAACEFIQQQCPIKPRLAFVESNLSGDKKATSGCFSHVRGKKVMAEVTIPNELLRKILRTTATEMTEYNRLGTTGAMISGAMGVNGHYSNGLAALFLACGQDVACVAEASIGITRMSVDDDGNLRTSVTLPNLPVGTVGGGTSLPTQKACLDLLGMHGTGKAKAFAEICAATCLAGELSLIGALCANEFSQAHKKYARSTK
jgi:hydroxymethylglutaryl-CoA reductase (NADPH)